ncbi:MAG: metallophosphoesterase [Treponema sp.]|nr:metallophosphoesterase [Treponema sp.]
MRWLFFSPVVFLIYAGICFYIGWRLLGFLRCFFPVRTLVFWLIFAVLCCVLVSINMFRHNLEFLRQAGLFWQAILLYMLMLLVLSDIFRLFLFISRKKIENINIYTVGAALLLCAILIVYGAVHARSIKTVNYNMTLRGSGSDMQIVLISDLHIGHSIGGSHIKKVVDVVNKAGPDIVFIAGDVFNGSVDAVKDLQEVISQLRSINAPLGVYACLGNHDVDRTGFSGGSTQRIEEILKDSGITLLNDETYKVREDLYLAGRKDARPIGMNAERKTPQELLAGIEGTIIVLDHQPTQFAQLEQAGAVLVLSGHTHKGQLFPATLITRAIFKRAGSTYYGYWQGQTMQAVVTSGSGFWGPPVRIATNSEVAIINLRFMP